MKEFLITIIVVLFVTNVQGQATFNRPVPINHFSIGGSETILTSLNHVNMQTIVLLNAPFKHVMPITSWQFYAESMMPFYPSLWRIVENSGRNFTVELIAFNHIIPIKTGYQEIPVPLEDQLLPTPGDLMGIFYSQSEKPDDEDVMGTVSMETYAREPTEGVTDDLMTSIVDNTPKEPLSPGYQFNCKAANNTARLLALRAVFEPEINKRGIPGPFRDNYKVEGGNATIPEFNVGRNWSTICDDGRHDIGLAWGHQACQRAYDSDYIMVTSFMVNITALKPDIPIAPPLLFNPTCFAQEGEKFGDSCTSSGTCTAAQVRAIVCAPYHMAHDVQKRVNDTEENSWNFLN